MNGKQIAFTLIELLVVIAIIGILSGLIVVTMNGVTQKANIAKAQAFSSSLRNALMLSLVSEWKLDDGSGTMASDSWSGGNPGTLTGFADTAAGYGDAHTSGWVSASNCVFGSCLKFDGADDYINLGNGTILMITDAITIEAWIRTSGFSGAQDVVAKSSSYDLEIHGTGRLVMALGTNEGWHFTQTSNAVLSADNWYHVAGSYDSSANTVKLYINGVLDKTDVTSTTGPIQITSNNVSLGYCNPAFPNRFTGTMDQIRIYKVAVPSSLVEEQYYAGLNNLLINGSISREEYGERISNIGKI